MTGLIEFLRTCLDEDQRQAEKLMRFAQDTHLTFQDHKRFLGRDVPGWHTWPDVEAMCARVLAEIAAKRQLLALVESYAENYEGSPVTWPEDALRLLAAPYADRPGFREEWLP